MMIKMAALPWRWIFCPLMALLRQNYICTIPLCHPMMKKRTPSSEILWGYVHHRNRYREFWGGANILRRSFIVMCICFILTSVLIYHWYRIMEKKVKPMMSWYSISSPNVAPKYGIDLFVCQMNKKMLIWSGVNECSIHESFIFQVISNETRDCKPYWLPSLQAVCI